MCAVGAHLRFRDFEPDSRDNRFLVSYLTRSQDAKKPVRFELAGNPEIMILLLNDREAACNKTAYVALICTFTLSDIS